MSAPKPGPWIGSKLSETAPSTSPVATETTSSPTKLSSPTSQKSTNGKRTYSNAMCVCGHRRGDHNVDAYTPEEASLDENVLGCTKVCDCAKYKKKPFERTEHLTNRPFGNNTDLIMLKDRLTVHDGRGNNKRKGKK